MQCMYYDYEKASGAVMSYTSTPVYMQYKGTYSHTYKEAMKHAGWKSRTRLAVTEKDQQYHNSTSHTRTCSLRVLVSNICDITQ